jgi:hypothetical protein
MFFDGKILKIETVPVRGSYLEHPELSLISYVKPIEKYLAFEPWTGIG